MDSSALHDFELLIDAEMQIADRGLQEALKAETFLAARRGAAGSSSAMIRLTTVASGRLPGQIRAAFTLFGRAMAAHGIAISSRNDVEVREILQDWTAKRSEHLKAEVRKQPSFNNSPINPDGILGEIDKVAATELQRINGEINLICAERERKSDSGAAESSTLIINGPVGQVFTGPGSFGVTIQNIDPEARRAIDDALAQVEKALAENDDLELEAEKSEIIEITAEARREIGTAKPNLAKIKALIAYVGGAITFAPKIKPAYEALKWAASLIGISLP